MRFFLDENFPKTATKLLVQHGHETFDIRGTNKEGASDADLFLIAQKLQAVFLTTDKDFFHTIPHIFPDHAGVVVIALKQPNREAILAKLAWLLEQVSAEHFTRRVFLLRNSGYVVYPPLEF
jgi:predicted nuclease of predicted toxin-antitoxin system